MVNELFILGSAVCFALILLWSFKHLPRERWQIIAAVPVKKDQTGLWCGINITYYGFIITSAQATAVSMFFILMGALNVSHGDLAIILIGLLFLCLAASKIVARIVEGKKNTFTVGGASFIGLISAPLIIWFFNGFSHDSVPMLPFLAAASISHAIGEGLGRLACLSFGCCYGKPIGKVHPFMGKLFEHFSVVFEGKTKKITYEAGMEGVKVFPIQSATSILYVSTGLIGTYLYLNGRYASAFLFTVAVTQGWRFFSEMLRADYRGRGKITAYQFMSLIGTLLAAGFQAYAPHTSWPRPNLVNGIRQLWNPGWIIFLQILWVTLFFYFGRSRVTDSTIAFNVRHDMT
ncbi:MAG: prolipoprotein diacylglyceryl transferase [Syntrophorhabdus aromaticivorans]|uniref:Prolipoprotein diacylglyceryl transferase n=1 Tax=Syntrophorhabdus aromaticivorans TaxID=328301 RepID=A0A971M327_9BACT|nr:prolipoprotein diacylglyceryl transferase [Syntrophorhabdus aromaticivorans]